MPSAFVGRMEYDMADINKYIFTILGGDRRQVVIANKLLSCGQTVRVYGLGEFSAHVGGAEIYSNIEKAILGSDIIILPLPVSRDNINLLLSAAPNVPSIKLNNIITLASRGGCKAILGGVISDEVVRLAEAQNISVIDYYQDPDLQRKNALPSAEGSLMIAMEHTEMTVQGMKSLVCGSGRIGSCLVQMLDKLGADVTVAARSDGALCEAALNGYKTVRLSDDNKDELTKSFNECDVVFNTVPHIVFTENILSKINKKPLYIEIASSPGGIDISAAREAGIPIIFAPSLPGKYAPRSAGRYIFEAIVDILKTKGIYIDEEDK